MASERWLVVVEVESFLFLAQPHHLQIAQRSNHAHG